MVNGKIKKIVQIKIKDLYLLRANKQTRQVIMVQFTMTLENSEVERKRALGQVTHKHIYLVGLQYLEDHPPKKQKKNERDNDKN